MNATNRVMNRVVLFLIGLVLLMVGLVAGLWAVAPSWAQVPRNFVHDRFNQMVDLYHEWTVHFAQIGTVPGLTLVCLGSAAVLCVLLIAFIFSRGGGRTSTVLRVDSDGGKTTIDRNIAEAFLGGKLRERTDVLSAHTAVYMVKRTPTVRLTLTTRPGANLNNILGAVTSAVQTWDALIGTEIPIVLCLENRRWGNSNKRRTRS